MTLKFYVAGQADSIGYATAERMADIVNVALENVSSVSTPFKAGTPWKNEATRLTQTYGFPVSSNVVVWNECGRLIGDEHAFQSLVKHKYGLEIDLSESQLIQYAAENDRQSRQ